MKIIQSRHKYRLKEGHFLSKLWGGAHISLVSEQTEKRGIWVLDRGGDRRKIIHHLLRNKHRFILRLKVDRHLVYRKKSNLFMSMLWPARSSIVKESQMKMQTEKRSAIWSSGTNR